MAVKYRKPLSGVWYHDEARRIAANIAKPPEPLPSGGGPSRINSTSSVASSHKTFDLDRPRCGFLQQRLDDPVRKATRSEPVQNALGQIQSRHCVVFGGELGDRYGALRHMFVPVKICLKPCQPPVVLDLIPGLL